MGNPRTLKQIKRDPRVLSVWQEDDCGELEYWAELAPGYSWEGVHTLHEATVKDLALALSCVVKCSDKGSMCASGCAC